MIGQRCKSVRVVLYEETGRRIWTLGFTSELLVQEKKRTIPRLGEPYGSPGARPVADSGIDIYPEIIFTLRCLEKDRLCEAGEL